MHRIGWLLLLWLFLTGAFLVTGAEVESYAKKVASLVDPAKLATLRARGANPRVQKNVAQLAEAKQAEIAPVKVENMAVALVGMNGQAAKLTSEAMVLNLTIAERMGCLDAEGLIDVRKGQAPTIRRGPYKGDQLSVDHIIPRAVAPEASKTREYLWLASHGTGFINPYSPLRTTSQGCNYHDTGGVQNEMGQGKGEGIRVVPISFR